MKPQRLEHSDTRRAVSNGKRISTRLLIAGAAASLFASCGQSNSASNAQRQSPDRPPQTTRVGQSGPPIAQAATEKVPRVDITVTSPMAVNPVQRRYTCDGADTPLPIAWSAVPHRTREVDLFVLSSLPIKGRFAVAWAIAGIPPSRHRISARTLPSSAVFGRSTTGGARYSLCPSVGHLAHYVALVYALPRRVPVSPGFDAERLVEGTLVHIAPSEGELGLSYQRR